MWILHTLIDYRMAHDVTDLSSIPLPRPPDERVKCVCWSSLIAVPANQDQLAGGIDQAAQRELPTEAV